MLRRILLSVSFISISFLSMAQMGTIKGSVKDVVTGEGIVGASVRIEGSTQGGLADISGNFQILKVKAGTYTLIISFVSYKTDTLKDVTVYPDQITLINTTLAEESTELTEVVVSGTRMKNTDVAILSDIKTSQLVVTGISAQQISMSQDRDAAQIVKRIPGVTIIGNKFVNVRGLSERYSTVLLNGVIAPSTEVDSRAFAFDLLPSNMIDRMMVYKSGGADMPGDFAGAVIDIGTKSVVDDNSLTVNITTGYRANTTFQDFKTMNGSSTDGLGFDNGYRDLPSGFPTDNLRRYTQNLSTYRNRSLIGEAGASLNNDWEAKNTQAAPDLRASINYSHVWHLGEKKLGNVTSLSYSNTRQHFDQQNNYYEAYNKDTGAKVGPRYTYKDNLDAVNTRTGVISNFIFELNPSNKIEFRNLFNQQGNSQVTGRGGFEQVQNNEVKNISLNYTERALYSGQLVGKHSLNDRVNLNWIFGYSNINSNQPDYRRLRSQRTIGTTAPFSIVIPPSASSTDGRFFSELNEKIYTHALNVEYKIKPDLDEEKQGKISAGYYLSQTKRDFSARWFSFDNFPGTDTSDPAYQALLQGSFNSLFVRDNLINPEDSQSSFAAPLFYLEEGTTGADAYTAKSLYTAGYLSFFMPFNDFKVSAGARVEYNNQELTSEDTNGDEVKVDNPITRVLPFMNVSYSFNEKTLIRLAYSNTLNRPIFRELAPFNYYDFDKNANTFGNPNLKTANIHNLDLRWEKYPSGSENISAGVFYKYFIDPIETALSPGGNIIYSFVNANSATSYGAEVEARKSLTGLTGSAFVDKLSILLNAAVIKSEVNLPNSVANNQEKNRVMQGQSPYIINAGIYYNDADKGLQVNLAYNVFGKRIFAVGDFNKELGIQTNPTQYEMPRNQIDLTISKDFGNRFNVKLGVQDILNQEYRLIQDSNSDKKITGFDDAIRKYKPGQYVTLGLTYKII